MADLGAIARSAGPAQFCVPTKFYASPSPALGEDNNSYIGGAVTELGIGPVPGTLVRLYYRPTGALIAQSFADASGVYKFPYLDRTDTGNYFSLAFDPAGGTQYNLAALDRMTPKPEPMTRQLQPQATPYGMGGFGTPQLADPYFSNVVLLLRADGADGSTTFTDSSSAGRTITTVSSAAVSTAVAKFGSGSARFNGANYLTMAASSDFAFGTGDFTVEGWVLIPAWGGSQGFRMLRFNNGTSNDFTFEVHATGGYVAFFGASGSTTYWSCAIAAATWTHVAFTRASGTMRAFVNGVNLPVAIGSASNSTNITSTQYLSLPIGPGFSSPEGYVDELRVTKNIARYVADFTPPTGMFPGS